jgi:predicted esterase
MVDMTADEQIEWAKKGLRPHALASMLTPAPEGNVSSWRIAYLITAEQDPAMPVPLQQWLIDNAKEAGAEIEEVKTLKSGHFVQITHAEEVASWISELSSS